VDVDAVIDRLQGDLFVPLLLGLAAASAYLVVLGLAHRKALALVALARQCRRRREEEERRERLLGYSPTLGRLRRLEVEIARRITR
jgi:hypothetical protein